MFVLIVHTENNWQVCGMYSSNKWHLLLYSFCNNQHLFGWKRLGVLWSSRVSVTGQLFDLQGCFTTSGLQLYSLCYEISNRYFSELCRWQEITYISHSRLPLFLLCFAKAYPGPMSLWDGSLFVKSQIVQFLNK